MLDLVRLHQDFAQLDRVCGGRAEIAAYAEPFEIFDVDRQSYDEVFAEKLDLRSWSAVLRRSPKSS